MEIPPKILAVEEWQSCRATHLAEVYPFTSNYRERRARGTLHPIYDFLFNYYTYSTKKLERWHPGYGVALEIPPDGVPFEYQMSPLYDETEWGVTVTYARIRPRDLKQLVWVHTLSKAILERTPRFSCFGLHEWAMVYRASELRHDYPLRLSPKEIAEVVESSTVCCSHFDAFRFFTPAAAPLNILQPSAEGREHLEQGACIHANMDLYKWAYKLSPIVSSELLREAFRMALRAREIDMRASPYDFTALGFEPIEIESESGRRDYQQYQAEIAHEAKVVRMHLISEVERVLEVSTSGPRSGEAVTILSDGECR